MKKKSFILFALAMFLQSCSSTLNVINNQSFYQINWVIPEAGKADKFFTVDKNGKASGFLGCNIFNATADVDTKKQTIEFSDILTTKRICVARERSQAEQDMKKALESAYKYQIDNETTLTLKDKQDNVLLVFKGYKDLSFRDD